MSDVPFDIVHEILSRLPSDSLFRFRAVCKEWHRIINDRLDSTLLIRDAKGGRLYSLSLDSLNYINGCQTIDDVIPIKQLIRSGVPRLHWSPVVSCNGLILIPDRDIEKNWVIWNPLIHDFRMLPLLNTALLRKFGYKHDWVRILGFGYDYASDDYKVVRIDRVHNESRIVYITLVYSLKLGFWRMINDFPCDELFFSRNYLFIGEGVFLNGALHWGSRNGIIVLDLGTEDYRQLVRPPPIPTRPRDDYAYDPLVDERLDALSGCLVWSYYHREMKSFEGWLMRDYGVEKSWMKLFSIEEVEWLRCKPVAYLKSKRQFLLQLDHVGLVWINLENNSLKVVTIDGLLDFSCSQFCPGSLFRLDDSGNDAAEGTAGVKRKRKREGTAGAKRARTRFTFSIRNIDLRCSNDCQARNA